MADRKLTIFITAADEPLVVNDFIREVVKAKSSQIIGIGLVKGKGPIPQVASRTKKGKKRPLVILSKLKNVLSLILIFGAVSTVYNACRVAYFHLTRGMNRFLPFYPTKSIKYMARKYSVPLSEHATVNDRSLLNLLHALKPDLIINQAPGILRGEFLSAAAVGVLNRHNALLPKNRGRFAPFWALYRGGRYTGVTIHFVTEALDAGDIILQEKIRISKTETVGSLVKKCYSVAPAAMTKAIEILESGNYELLPNRDDEATYNSNPTLTQVLRLRGRQIRRTLCFSEANLDIEPDNSEIGLVNRND